MSPCVHKAREETPWEASSCVKGGNVRIHLVQTLHISLRRLTLWLCQSACLFKTKLLSETTWPSWGTV